MTRNFKNTDISQLHEMIQTAIDCSYPAHYPKRAVQLFKDYHSETNIKERGRLGELLVR